MSDDVIRNHRDLKVWQVAMQVRRDVRKTMLAIPRQDRLEIGGQVTRAAWSIPCNIAEGHERLGRQDYKQFLSYARGSGGELDTQLVALADDHPHLEARIVVIIPKLQEVSRMITRSCQNCEGRGSRVVEGRGSRVEGRGFRVEGLG